MDTRLQKRNRRHKRIRARVSGSADIPRFSVFKSNKSLYGQLVNDDKGQTLAAVTTFKMKGKSVMDKAKEAGKEIARLAKEKGIEKVVFDRGGFIYTGRVKAFADGARDGGLKF